MLQFWCIFKSASVSWTSFLGPVCRLEYRIAGCKLRGNFRWCMCDVTQGKFGKQRLGLVRSQDGVNWRKVQGPGPGGSLLEPGQDADSWEGNALFCPGLVRLPDGTFVLYYHTSKQSKRYVIIWQKYHRPDHVSDTWMIKTCHKSMPRSAHMLLQPNQKPLEEAMSSRINCVRVIDAPMILIAGLHRRQNASRFHEEAAQSYQSKISKIMVFRLLVVCP